MSPPVIAGAIAYAAYGTAAYGALVATPLIFGASIATLTGYAVTIGASVAYSSAQSAKARRALGSASVDQGRTVMARDAIGPRRLIYGQTLVSGNIVFMHTTGTKNEYLHLVVVLAGHEVEELGDIYFGDELIPLSGNASTGRTAGYVRINKKRGVAGDVADADLVSETAGIWTSAHKLSGCAYIVARLQWSADIFPNGIPAIKCVVKGKKVYDPRSGLTAYSANSALCVADFLADPTWGKGVAQSRIRSADLIEAANTCDEDVTLADATTENRYETHGTVNSNQDPNAILLDLTGAMAGCVVDTGGTWTVRAGAHRTSTVTLTDGDLMGGFSVQPRQSRQDSFNRIRGVYVSSDNQWAPADLPALSNATYKAADGGVWLDRDVQLNFTSSSATGQRLLKIELERGRQQITCSGVYSLKAMQLMPGDTVAITRASLGWTAKLFSVVGWTFQLMGENESVSVGVSLELQETAAGVWDWANGEETTEDLAPNTTLPNPFTVSAPSLTLLTNSTTVTIQPDGTVQPRLKVSWATPNNIHVESGGTVEVEFKKTADTDYTVWSAVRGNALFDYILDVKVGVQYDVRVRFCNNAGVRGAYTTATSSAVVGDTTVPNGVAATISATARAGFIDLQWTPSTSGTVNEYFIYRSIVSAVAGFALLAQTANSQYQDSSATAGTTYWYYVVAQSVSGINSADSSVVTAAAIFAPNGVVPSNPTAPAQPSPAVAGTEDASDGSVFAKVTLEIPAMPAGAVWQNLLYRRTGAGDWMVAAQYKNTVALTVALGTAMRLDDLSPGLGYDIALQAWNGAGGSSIVPGTSFTASTKTAASSLPTSVIPHAPSSSYPVAAHYFGATQEYSSLITFTPSASKDVEVYEFGINTTAGQDPTQSGGFTFASVPSGATSVQYNTIVLVAQYLWYRAKNVSGVWTAWADSGYNMNGYVAIPAGTMSAQNASAVAITGGTVSGVAYSDSTFIADVGIDTAPTYTFTGDTDTGMYQYLPNAIGFATGGVVRTIIFGNTFYLSSGMRFRLGNQYVAGAPTATGYLLVEDQSGNTYEIPAKLH